MPKKILQTSILGQQGINLIEQIVLEIGFIWYPTGGLEAGVDGFIEIRDPTTGTVTNSVIQVQSRATASSFRAETPTSFEYLCDQRDLDYWLSGNVPIILVLSRPPKSEAYWVSVKDYFKDATTRRTRRVHFDKRTDRLTSRSRTALMAIAVPRDTGLYFAPPPIGERLYSNLLLVNRLPSALYIASTEYRLPGHMWAECHRLGIRIPAEWFLHNKQLLSFHDLSEPPWDRFCERGTVESCDVSEWFETCDSARRRQFVRLLNYTLKEKVRRLAVWYAKDLDLYYFRPTPDLSPRKVFYQSLARGQPRTVFRGYTKKTDPTTISYYRHSAFQGRFLLIDAAWHLEITPSYYFKRDGYRLHRFYEDYLKGIKRLEHNAAVLGQLLMWADYLSRPADMFTEEYPFLGFGTLVTFDTDVGIDDRLWLPGEEERVIATPRLTDDGLPLFDYED